VSFHDVELPSAVQFGSVSGFGFATQIQQTGSGHEIRIARQSQARHRLVPIKDLESDSDGKALLAFVRARRGSLHSFRVKDWADYTTNSDGTTSPTSLDQIIGTGDGTTTQFQLLKIYNLAAAGEYVRTLTLPETSSVVCAVNGVPTGSFSVNSVGVVTFSVAPPNGQLVTAGCEFRVQCRFEMTVDQAARLEAIAYGLWRMQDFAVVEVLSEAEYPERWFAGGMKDWGTRAADVSIAFNDGQLHWINPSSAINLFLPPATYHPGGWNVFAISVYPAAASTVQVRDDAGNTVGAAFGAGVTRQLGLVRSGSSYSWVLA
jgi:uncharacterized protein (TIGR02217 family)